MTRNHDDSRKWRPVKATMIDFIDDTVYIGPSLPLTVTTTGHKFTARPPSTYYKLLTQAAWTQWWGHPSSTSAPSPGSGPGAWWTELLADVYVGKISSINQNYNAMGQETVNKPVQHILHVSLINSRSVVNKLPELHDMIYSSTNTDCFCLTETWLTEL